MLSAPFGHGKSTFLDVFFEAMNEEYDVFKVYPVNYSVSNNKDIFKYIKADILLQLLSYENVNLNQIPISIEEKAFDAISKKPISAFKNFVKFI